MSQLFHGNRSCCRALPILLAAICCAGAAHALERVNLRNGFSYDCARQEPLDRAHVRLILPDQAPSAAPNYIDLPVSSIASVETLPDPPVLPAVASAKTQSAADVPTLLAHAGRAHDIDAELLASIVHAESGGHAQAVSRTGAEGLMQLMPSTAHSLGVADAFKPDQNIAGGAAYLDSLLIRYRDNLALALAAYNAGPGAVDRYRGIPPFPETRAYVARVMTEFKRRKQAAEQAVRGAR